jgi:hypothetical protein
MKEVTSEYPMPGTLEIDETNILFTPLAYLTKKRNQMLDRVADGEDPYLDLSTLIGSLPSQFPDVSTAEQVINARYSPEKLLLADSIVLSQTWIVFQTKKAIEAAVARGSASLEVGLVF